MKFNKYLRRINIIIHYKRKIKIKIKNHKPPKLSPSQKRQIKDYYSKKGFKSINTYWHQYYGGFNNNFSVKYIPEDVFHSIIEPALNSNIQWPSLLDKNLLVKIFNKIQQPPCVINNINGFYFERGIKITREEAIEKCLKHNFLVIKPSIESGGGSGVVGFSIINKITSYNNYSLERLFSLYSKDFIVQEVVSQHTEMKKLNPTSLNTIRIISYLKEDKVIILSSIVRIGKLNSFLDNSSSGGISCGILENGNLKECGYIQAGERRFITDSGVKLKGVEIPSYKKVLELVETAHLEVPYFRLVAWDIGINDKSEPVLIEYNTLSMGISSHQLTNGPLFGNYVDELLEIGRNNLTIK